MEAVLVSSPFRAHPAHAMVRNVIRLIRPNDGSPCFLHGGARKASCAHTAPQTPCASQKRRLRRQPRCLTPDKWSVARSLGSRSLLPRVAMLVVLAPRAFLLPTSTRWVSSPMSALSSRASPTRWMISSLAQSSAALRFFPRSGSAFLRFATGCAVPAMRSLPRFSATGCCPDACRFCKVPSEDPLD